MHDEQTNCTPFARRISLSSICELSKVLSGDSNVNQITSAPSFVFSESNNLAPNPQSEFGLRGERQISELEQEIDNLRSEIAQLNLQNDALIRLIDCIFPSPQEKRELMTVLERKYTISRRRACRLLSFARSTCWYRKASATQTVQDVQQTTLRDLDRPTLVKRMAALCRRVDSGSIPVDSILLAEFEYGLRRLGLSRAAHISLTNVRLAMEIFKAWNKSRQLKRQPNSSTASSYFLSLL